MTVTEPGPAREIGKARRRKEDARLITGRTRWTDNIVLPGMLHLAILRSPFAHAHDHLDRHLRGQGRGRAWSRSSPARTSPTSRAACPAPGRSRRT